MAGKVPYNHLVFKGEDPRTALVGMCLQVLCVLLDFQSGPALDASSGTGETATSAPTSKTNAFRYFLAKLASYDLCILECRLTFVQHRTQDFAFILDGIINVLEQQLAVANNLLPGSKKSVPYVPETKIRAYLLDSDKATDVLAYLLCYGLDIKDKPQQHGHCRALTYIIQTLSAEPAFGNKLSNPIKVTIPKWATPGTAADFMITAIYSMIATTSGALNSLYPALIIALSNAAPYFKNLSVVSSTRLVQMFKSFSNPRFLLSDESHPRLLFFMLEVFNSVIFHQLSDNPNLLYGILTAHNTFQELGTFTLAGALRDIKRVELAREEQATQSELNRKEAARSENDLESGDPVAEKMRLLQQQQDREAESSHDSNTQVEEGSAVAEPTLPQSSESASGTPTSENVKGKMRERRSLSVDANSSAERLASAGIGRNGFVPTQEWVTSWQQGLPLDTVMLVISELLPKVQNLQAGRHKASTTGAITDFLQSVTLDHVLPPRPQLYPRRFMWSDASIVWLTSLIWGEIYVHGMSPLGIWNSTNVRLFFVKHTQTQQRQITETMSSVVGGLFSPSRQRSDHA
ncbi:high-temperature-induced dauer-formation protein-domain-containing protein [Chiua virens]|nr:high-temperature-induced dauer-formation protein-domain-containing protein [Chiua virens]